MCEILLYFALVTIQNRVPINMVVREGRLKTLHYKVLIAAAFTVLLVACSNQQQIAQQAETTPTQEEPKQPPVRPTVANKRFTVDTLYALLVAEMAIDRKRYDIALGNYVQQATSTKDLLVTARAAHIARGLNARQSALEMSQLWLDLDPDDQEARLIATIELIEANFLLEAFEVSKQMLKSGETSAFESIATKAEKGDISIVNELSTKYQELLETHQKDPGLWLGQSILLLQEGRLDEALEAAQNAITLDGNSIRSGFQETRVLHKMGNTAEANKRLAQLVEKNPKNIGLRARYARLVWSTSPEIAQEQFEILHKSSPADAEILYSLGLVEKDLGRLDTAKKRFELLLSRNQYPSVSNYHIGDMYNSQKQYELAFEHFRKVTPGQNYARALAKASDILVAKSQREEAIALVKSEQAGVTGEHLENLYSLEAAIYSNAGQMNASEKALTEGLTKFPNSTRLLYTRAMLYTQIDYISAAEKDLKKLLELVPENAAALNALGYTLADRTDRLQEAYEYIKQAYALTPEDPAVIDSMGWIAYRLGNFDEALEKLTRAMDAFPDHEIAAHLGEVLWVTGNQKRAIDVWKKGLELNPESKIIHKTLHRLEATLD